MKKDRIDSPKIPNLRFDGFRGEWECKKIGDLLTLGSGRDYKHLDKGKIPVYGTGGYMTSVNQYLYDGESIGIGRKGTIDKPVYIEGKFWTVDTLFYSHSFTELKPKFGYYIFQNINWKRYNEASGVPSLSKGTIEKISVNIPSILEQEQIDSFLTKVDSRITTQMEIIEHLKSLKAGLSQRFFSQEIRFKDDGGNDYPEWEEMKLGDLLDYEQPTRYLVDSTEYLDEYKTPVLTAGKTFLLGYTNEEDGIFQKKLPTIIFDDFTTAFQFVDFPFKAKSSAMKMLLPKSSSLNLKFLFEAMKTIKFPLGEHKRYWISEYQYNKVFQPCLKEQSKIANTLSSIDKKIELEKSLLNEYQEQKRYLLQNMFI